MRFETPLTKSLDRFFTDGGPMSVKDKVRCMTSAQPDPARSKGLPTVMEPNILWEPLDFSLVLGAPMFQLFRRSHLAGDDLELVNRRLLIITPVAWLPLLLLAILGSSAANIGGLPFLHDVEVAGSIPHCTSGLHRRRADRSFADASRCAPVRRAAYCFTPGSARFHRAIFSSAMVRERL